MKYVKNIGEFDLAVRAHLKERRRFTYEEKKADLLNPSLQGNKVALEVFWGSYKYRFNANNSCTVIEQFLDDAKTEELVVVSVTKASGEKIDTKNHADKPRSQLYLYRSEI